MGGDLLHGLVFDYTLRTVALGSAALGIVSGALGSFAVLRRRALLGDAVSHAALPGIALAYMIVGSKAPLVLMLGAAIAGWIGTLFIMAVVRNTRLKDDTALGLVLSVFFGVGLVLLTFLQKRPDAAQAGLDTFLFGQAATLLAADVVTMAVLGGIVLLLTGVFWKEFKLLTFNPEFAGSLGFPVRVLDILLTSLLVMAIVIGLQTVGVVLMSAMVVAPASAARQWTDKLGVMVVLSAVFGALAGVTGALISSSMQKMPTGPTIVLCISAIVVVSILVAPNRGLLWAKVRQVRNRRRLQSDKLLTDLYALALQHEDPTQHTHNIAALNAMNPEYGDVGRTLHVLEERNLVKQSDEPGEWSITESGLKRAAEYTAKLTGGSQ